MLIVTGAYHFWPKRVAFRNDYCLRCQAPRRAIAVRTFDVGYVYWIPILPVGFWKHWKCTVCGSDPHANAKTRRRSFLLVGLLCMIGVCVMLWALPEDTSGGAQVWFLRVAALAVTATLLVYLLRGARGSSLKHLLATIEPAADAVCPFCATPLLASDGGRWACRQCGAERC